MPAGPFPTKVMHEALKGRVATLENAPPSAGGGAAIPETMLSDTVALDTTGRRAIDPAEIPNGLRVRSCTLTLAPEAPPLAFSGLRNGFSQGYAGLSIFISSSEQAFNQGNYDVYAGGAEGGETVLLPESLTIPPGGFISASYWQWHQQGDLFFRADPALPAGVAYSVNATDNTGAPIAAPLVGLPFILLTPGNVLGTLAPDAMNVRATPSTLANGDFEIVDPGNAAPILRYRASSGTVYRLAMTPEV